MGLINNHEQTLYGLRYFLTAQVIGSEYAFHEDRGFFFWDAKNKQAMRCATTPRRNSFIAGGTVDKTVCFEMKITIHSKDSFSYDQDTQLQIKGNPNLFHHTDKNTQSRVKQLQL